MPENTTERRLWVAFMPDGFPCGVMNMDHKTGDDATKAARKFWDTARQAREKANEGYRMELLPWSRWTDEFMPIHLGEVLWKAAS